MTILERVDAVAFYGSMVRGDRDRFSDRDVLLVSDDDAALNEGKLWMEENGFSCACYSWVKLEFLARRKALFIQHLKQESRIVIDKGQKLNFLLSQFSPDSTYIKQIDTARELVSVTECFPDTLYGIGWALDVMAVGFRNLAILALANEGKYLFSFSGILGELKKIGMINSDEEARLRLLREYKASFRRKAYHLLPPKEEVFELRQLVGEVFDTNPSSRLVSEEVFHNFCLRSNSAFKSSHWYLKARLYEGAFLGLNHPSRRIDSSTLRRLQAVENAIASPGCYSALFMNSADNLRREVIDLSDQFRLKAA
jgi:hypothetical protein